MIKYFHKNNNKNIILFIHGFMGGNKTWSEDGISKIPQYLLQNSQIKENFDLAQFNYFTLLSAKLEHVRYIWGLMPFGSSRQFKKNQSINDIKDILYSHVHQAFKEYDKVIIVAHSMGGLIAKAAILKLIEENNNKVELFLSLAVPHNGSKIADFARFALRLSNPNIKDLEPLSSLIDEVTRKWIDAKIIDSLPETIYYQGKNDYVVSKGSSAGYDSRKVQIVYSDDDHSSILMPMGENTIVIASMRDSILNTLKKKTTPETRLIQTDISEKSLEELTEKIGQKLGLNQLSFNNESFQRDNIPLASSHKSLRVKLIEELLREKPQWLHLIGMHSTGKSQLALLIQAYVGTLTIWINFKEIDGKDLVAKINSAFGVKNIEEFGLHLTSLIAENKIVIVLDDLPKFGASQYIDNGFNDFLSACFKVGVFILSTSNFKLSTSITTVHGESVTETTMRLLSREECDEVLDTYPDSSRFEFKDLIYDITRGHPVYLQVVCRFLQNRDWKIQHDELVDFFKGTIFTDLTDETLSKFVSNVEDDQTRDLLYRLNVIKSAISENEVRLVSDCSPGIRHPLEKISTVIGTWVQRETNQYIVSPLFKRLGAGNLSEKILKDINFALGNSLLSKGTFSQYDVKHILSYFKDAKAYDVAGFITLNLLKHCHKNSDYYYNNNLDLYTWYDDILPVQIPLLVRLLIRSLQLNLALERTKAEVDLLRDDLILLVEQALKEKVDICLPALILSSSYLKEDSALSIKYFSYYLNSQLYNSVPELASPEFADLSEFDNSVIWLLLLNVDSIETIDEWFKNVKILSQALSENTEQAYILSNQLFLNILKREQTPESQDWDRALATLNHIYNNAAKLGLHTLKAMSLKNIIFVRSEKQGNIQAAEDVYLTVKEQIADDLGNFLVKGELGRQLYLKGNREKAEEYLTFIAGFNAEKFITVKADTLQTLSIVVGETNPTAAHKYMEEVIEFVTDNIYIDEISYVHSIGDYAISLFLSGDIKGAMKKLVMGYSILIDSFENNELYINAQIKYGNAIGYMLHLLEHGTPPSGDSYTAPYRGMISRYANLQNLFFPEKINIVIFHIIRFYEVVNELVAAKQWTARLFSLKDTYDLKIFHKMLSTHLGYFIMDGNYEEAIEQQIQISHKTRQMLESDAKTIENEHEKAATESIQSAESEIKAGGDIDLYIYAINPILYHLLNEYLEKKIDLPQLVGILKSLLLRFEAIFEDNTALNHIIYILNNFPKDNKESQEILIYTSKVDAESFGLVQMFSYLICTVHMPVKEALDIHFKLSIFFALYKGNINNDIITNFFYSFWSQKLINEPDSFKAIKKIAENFKKILQLPVDHQLQAIFTQVAEGTNYKIEHEYLPWLQKYFDLYGE